MNELKSAGIDEIYVCGCCGKVFKDPYKVDVSCMLNKQSQRPHPRLQREPLQGGVTLYCLRNNRFVENLLGYPDFFQ